MDVLFNLIAVIISPHIHISNHHVLLYTLKIYNFLCQYYLDKTGGNAIELFYTVLLFIKYKELKNYQFANKCTEHLLCDSVDIGCTMINKRPLTAQEKCII